jgi:hypothetical protein
MAKKEHPSSPPGWKLPDEQGEVPEQRPIEEMSLEELEAETKRLQWEQTKAEYERLAQREQTRAQGQRQEQERTTWSLRRRGYWRGGS